MSGHNLRKTVTDIFKPKVDEVRLAQIEAEKQIKLAQIAANKEVQMADSRIKLAEQENELAAIEAAKQLSLVEYENRAAMVKNEQVPRTVKIKSGGDVLTVYDGRRVNPEVDAAGKVLLIDYNYRSDFRGDSTAGDFDQRAILDSQTTTRYDDL